MVALVEQAADMESPARVLEERLSSFVSRGRQRNGRKRNIDMVRTADAHKRTAFQMEHQQVVKAPIGTGCRWVVMSLCQPAVVYRAV
jgi:hypothetical protein